MKTSAAVVMIIVAVLISTFTTGCAQNREVAAAQRENAELRARVATLESQVAQLKDEQARSPITIDGLTLSKLDVGELRLSPKPIKPAERESSWVLGSGRLMITGTNTYTGNITIEKGAPAKVGGIIQDEPISGPVFVKRFPATTTQTTTTKSTSSTTATPRNSR